MLADQFVYQAYQNSDNTSVVPSNHEQNVIDHRRNLDLKTISLHEQSGINYLRRSLGCRGRLSGRGAASSKIDTSVSGITSGLQESSTLLNYVTDITIGGGSPDRLKAGFNSDQRI